MSSLRVSCVVFDPQNPNILASCSRDETVKIWDITSGSCLVTLTGIWGNLPVRSVAFSPDARRIAAGCGAFGRGEILIFKLQESGDWEMQSECPLRGHTAGNLQCTCRHFFDEDGDDHYELNPDCPVRGHGYVPFPCIECLLL